jgi:hypothetical protein
MHTKFQRKKVMQFSAMLVAVSYVVSTGAILSCAGFTERAAVFFGISSGLSYLSFSYFRNRARGLPTCFGGTIAPAVLSEGEDEYELNLVDFMSFFVALIGLGWCFYMFYCP